jgi:ABC-2 type transport system ATP-binding protein
MSSSAVYVQTDSLSKHYGSFAALRQCSLGVARGEVFGLLGPNGSGKTTLLRCLMGFLRPTAGAASIEGLDCYRDSLRVRERVAYLPGEARLFRQMRGHDVLKFFADVRKNTSYARSLALAERLGLDASRRVRQMSTGMRQKLALAAVFAPDVPLIILDEPTSSLDPNVRSEVLQMVSQARDQGRTIIFSSHVLSEVEQVCDRVVILRRGELVHTQVMAQLHRRHRIKARVLGKMPGAPDALNGSLRIVQNGDDRVTIETPDELAPLLGWLAGLPLDEIRIEPIGLQTVYEQFHPSGAP